MKIIRNGIEYELTEDELKEACDAYVKVLEKKQREKNLKRNLNNPTEYEKRFDEMIRKSVEEHMKSIRSERRKNNSL